jgi:hypothetical protein
MIEKCMLCVVGAINSYRLILFSWKGDCICTFVCELYVHDVQLHSHHASTLSFLHFYAQLTEEDFMIDGEDTDFDHKSP